MKILGEFLGDETFGHVVWCCIPWPNGGSTQNWANHD